MSLFEEAQYLEISLVVFFWLHCGVLHQTSALNKVKKVAPCANT